MSDRFGFLRWTSYSAVVLLGACSVPVEGDVAAGADPAAPAESVESASQALVLWSDPELAAYLLAASAGEVAEAQLALTRAADPMVIEFAQTMIAAHTSASQEVAALLAQLGLGPVDNPLSVALVEQSAQRIAGLQALAGPAFDRAYMDSQVQIHAALLSQLQAQLASSPPGIERSVLDLVPRFRSTVAQHLGIARSIRGSLTGEFLFRRWR